MADYCQYSNDCLKSFNVKSFLNNIIINNRNEFVNIEKKMIQNVFDV